ncbi:biotin transporter BioY [Desulfitobacterium hafniense]|uniref:biotin transporter BioY n=1 Tax=Desulfitobacterium hafniense TaxID=49338 RepID=UPI00037D5DA7|nr:biotin transporter BioY [Desulfitobacterium hafniense]
MNAQHLAKTAAMAALLCLAGMIMRWASPALVPFSVLPVFVFLTGLILGPKYGSLAVIVYVFLGLLGLPVFASAPFGGIGYVLKPSFGYLLGDIAAAYTVGKLYNRQSLLSALLAVLGGIIVLYLIGLTYFYLVMHFILHQSTTMALVISMGFLPFIAGDLIKGGIAAWVGNQLIKRQRSSSL